MNARIREMHSNSLKTKLLEITEEYQNEVDHFEKRKQQISNVQLDIGE